MTVRPDLKFAVSASLRDDYQNGRVYYALDGKEIRLPSDPAKRPERELLEWHGEEVFRG